MEPSKALAELAKGIGGHVLGSPQTVVSDVTHDSRQAGPGALFVAISGEAHDGHDYAAEALANGAAAVCVERPLEVDGPQLVVGDTRAILGQLAAEVHDHPSRSLALIGVTGTNGKTTVTHLIDSLLAVNGIRSGLIGTIGSQVAGQPIQSVRTTPEASDFQRLLASMRDQGARAVAAEISSHALELQRVAATRFTVAAFTNLSQDHLDFHGSMARYRSAKERLFTEFEVNKAVLNVDDPMGQDLAELFAGDKLTVGASADFSAEVIEAESGGTRLVFNSPEGRFDVVSPLIGEFNVSNLLVAVACCYAIGLPVEASASSVGEIPPVPGRFEMVSSASGPTVVVDYAHTPEGISKAISAARRITSGRVVVVFGAGGDRDRAKRPMMGKAAMAGDVVIVTSDNPRSEDPDTIIDQILDQVEGSVIREPDRGTAIEMAIQGASDDDIVLLLGKGHEVGQESMGEIVSFDDREVARSVLKSRRKSTNSGPNSGSMGS